MTKDAYKLVKEIKEMDTYKEIVKESYGGVMYTADKNKYSKDINKKFQELKDMNFDVWYSTDGIFRGVYAFIMGGC